MYVFENYDRDGLEANSLQKISKSEKAITNKIGELLKIVVKRTEEAEVYGDLYKIEFFLRLKVEDFQGRAEEIADVLFEKGDEGARLVVTELENMVEEMKGHRGSLY
jgi:hypothetical protein